MTKLDCERHFEPHETPEWNISDDEKAAGRTSRMEKSRFRGKNFDH